MKPDGVFPYKTFALFYVLHGVVSPKKTSLHVILCPVNAIQMQRGSSVSYQPKKTKNTKDRIHIFPNGAL